MTQYSSTHIELQLVFFYNKDVKTEQKAINCTSRADQQNEQKLVGDHKLVTSSFTQKTEEKGGCVR